MFNRTLIYEPKFQAKNLIISLCGRSISIGNMFGFTAECAFEDNAICTIEPCDFEWYPIPNGPFDQYESVKFLNNNIIKIKDRIEKIQKLLNIPSDKTFVLGYSAGAVVALKLLELINIKYAGFIVIGGCSLEPHKMLECKTQTPLLVIHNKNDNCFDWYERYLPTKKALLKNKYNLSFIERPFESHALIKEDIFDTKEFIGKYS